MMIKIGIIDLWELNKIIYNINTYYLYATLTYKYILISSSERIWCKFRGLFFFWCNLTVEIFLSRLKIFEKQFKASSCEGTKNISPVIPHSNQYYFSIFVSSFVYIALTNVLESKGNYKYTFIFLEKNTENHFKNFLVRIR